MPILRAFAFSLALCAALPAKAADPFVTVMATADGSTGLAWWLLDMDSQPSGTIVGGVDLAQINFALARGEAPWCAAQALTPASFASTDPTVSAEIAQYLRRPDGNIFRATTRMTGVPLLAVVGSARACSGEIAPFLLLVDQSRATPRVAYARTFLGWTPFVAMRADGNRLILATCLECDHEEVLYYNRRTRRFSWRSEGR